MKPTDALQTHEAVEPDFSQSDADAKPPLVSSQEKKVLSFFTLDDVPEVFRSHWLVKGIIPLTGVGIIYGEYSSGKTFFVIELALAIAGGKDFFGRKVKQKPVLYFSLEGKAGFMNRLAAWKKTHHEWPSNIQFNTADFNFFGLSKEEISKFPKNCVIIIDTLNKTDPTLDENTSTGMGKIIARAKEYQEITNGLILFIHHSGKDATKGARGHSSLMGAVDVAILVTSNGTRSWKIVKNKDGKTDISGNFILQEISLGIDDDGEQVTSCVVQPCKAPENPKKELSPLLDAIYKIGIELCENAGTDKISTETWRLKVIEQLAKEKANRRNFFNEKKRRLLASGVISENQGMTQFLQQTAKLANNG